MAWGAWHGGSGPSALAWEAWPGGPGLGALTWRPWPEGSSLEALGSWPRGGTDVQIDTGQMDRRMDEQAKYPLHSAGYRPSGPLTVRNMVVILLCVQDDMFSLVLKA